MFSFKVTKVETHHDIMLLKVLQNLKYIKAIVCFDSLCHYFDRTVEKSGHFRGNYPRPLTGFELKSSWSGVLH